MQQRARTWYCLTALAALASGGQAGTPQGSVIATMDELIFKAPKEKGKAELIEGKLGKAIQFSFEKDARSTFLTSNIGGSADWDKAAGFSFWVKGDGKDQFGGLQFIYDNDYAVRYDYVFPIKGTDWRKITVAWQDLLPVLSGSKSKPLAIPDGNKPSKLSGLWIGRWWYWGDYPALIFAIDDIRLEPDIQRDLKSYRPEGDPLSRVAARAKAGKPITIVTMGDSLTDLRHWANRKVSWPSILKDRLKEKHRSEVTIVNPAIGGTELRQNLVLIPRWLAKSPEPDLVTICFGGNDWNSGMRGEQFQEVCTDAVDRVRRATKGKADILLLTTAPSAAQWETMAELAEACRKSAKASNAGLADIEKVFHNAGSKDRDRLYVQDRVHLSPVGHQLVAETVFRVIEGASR